MSFSYDLGWPSLRTVLRWAVTMVLREGLGVGETYGIGVRVSRDKICETKLCASGVRRQPIAHARARL
jgi:hypothetical protein